MVKANSLVREANYLAQEMGKQTEFHVTLQIPSANLTPNRKVSPPNHSALRPTVRSVRPTTK